MMTIAPQWADAVGGVRVEATPPRSRLGHLALPLLTPPLGLDRHFLRRGSLALPYHIKRHHNAERYATSDREMTLVAMPSERDA